jgi:hypothetical protein
MVAPQSGCSPPAATLLLKGTGGVTYESAALAPNRGAVDTGIRNGPMSWDLAPDGNRFLIITANSAVTSSLTVALNWRVRDK